jgi:hypothetical protein
MEKVLRGKYSEMGDELVFNYGQFATAIEAKVLSAVETIKVQSRFETIYEWSERRGVSGWTRVEMRSDLLVGCTILGDHGDACDSQKEENRTPHDEVYALM